MRLERVEDVAEDTEPASAVETGVVPTTRRVLVQLRGTTAAYDSQDRLGDRKAAKLRPLPTKYTTILLLARNAELPGCQQADALALSAAPPAAPPP